MKKVERYSFDWEEMEYISKESLVEMLARVTEFLNVTRNSDTYFRPELHDILPLLYIEYHEEEVEEIKNGCQRECESLADSQ